MTFVVAKMATNNYASDSSPAELGIMQRQQDSLNDTILES
jgi:hypothetical protein